MKWTIHFNGVSPLSTCPGCSKAPSLPCFWVSLTFWGGALVGLVFAALKTYGGPVLRRLANAYVIFFTNTPALVQIWFLYFGLPDVGIVWDKHTCMILGPHLEFECLSYRNHPRRIYLGPAE